MTASADRQELALLGPVRPDLLAALEQRFTLHRTFAEPDPLAALKALGPRLRGVVSNGMAGISRAQMEALPKLEICAINGVGLETTDLACARERGVTITITPVLYDDVADLALALALAACRRIAEGDRYVRSGAWLQGRMALGRKFSGMRAGIVGYGRIGREVAGRLQGFKADIAYVDPVVGDLPYRRYEDVVSLARDSDILFLCAAGGPKGSPPIITRDVIEALGPRGIFVNIARGWLVDEPALVEALGAGRLGAAGLDVFDDEPNVPEGLLKLDRVVLTPHIASSTEETMTAMGECVLANLVAWFERGEALTPVR
jgi:lactate dehydrogenase-like 2-hydroxyacid dehydrogenase